MLQRITLVAVVLASVALVFLALWSRSTGELSAREEDRRELGAGAELYSAKLFRGEQADGMLYAVFLDPQQVEVEIAINRESRPLEELARHALAVVNAGFFTPERKPTGLLMSRGEVLSPFVGSGGPAGSGVFLLRNGSPAMLEREGFTADELEGAVFAVQAGPRIIEADGSFGIHSDDGQRANRTIIGADSRGRVVIAVAVGPGGWSTGPTLFELQRLLSSRLKLSFALNLDGGPSTGLYVRGPFAVELPESAPVHSVLAWSKKL